MKKLLRNLKQQKKSTEQVKLPIYGSLGIPINGQKTVNVPNRQGYVYVRLRDNQNEVIQAFNNKVSASYDLPVIVVREGSRYVVQQFNTQRYLNNAQNPAPFLPGHGSSHSFPDGGGADVTWVYGKQIMPALVYPNAETGTNVRINQYPMFTQNNTWVYAGGTGTVNLLQYNPTTGSSGLAVLIYLDANTGNPGVLVGSGSYFPANISGSIYPYLPVPAQNQIPLAAVRLVTGTQSIGWGNIYDVRQWVRATPSGTSGGSTSLAVQDEGVQLGTSISTLNFRGTPVSVTVSGTVADIFVTGSSGGTSPAFDNFWTSGTAAYSIQAISDVTPAAAGAYAFAIGSSIASGTLSFAQGSNSVAFGANSHAEGSSTKAHGPSSHAEGQVTVAYGTASHAEGLASLASGTAAFAAGNSNSAIASNSAALGGLSNTVSGLRSVILGGSGSVGTEPDTVYVPRLNIKTLYTGSSVALLGITSNGNIVTGTVTPFAGVDQIGIFGRRNGVPLGTGTILDVQGAGFSISGTVLQLTVTGSAPFTGVDQIGVFGLANGVPLGTGTSLNVQGAAFTVSGTRLNLVVTGSTPYVVTQDEGVYVASGTILNFNGAGVTASQSGTVTSINIPYSKSSQILFTHGNNGSVPASTTNYLNLHVFGLSSVVTNIAITKPYTIKNLYVNTNSTQPASGSLVFTVQKGGVDTAITTTVAANTAAGQFTDTTNSVTGVSGDQLQLKIVNNATGTSAAIIRCSLEIIFDLS